QLTSLVRADALDTGNELVSARLADQADALPWVGPAPQWLNNATTRQAYIAKFYEQAALSSRDAAAAVFTWMQDKVVNEHLALNDPDQFVDAHWTPGLLSTRCRLVLREEETVATGGGDEGVDDDALKGFPEATLQVARVGVRAYEPVLRYLLRWLQRQQRSKRNSCSKWVSSSPRHLDAALESRALSLALRAFLAWPGASELVLPGLEHLNAEQLFFIFYALNQCEANGPDVEQMLAARHKRRDGTARQDLAAWINEVATTNEDFARVLQVRFAGKAAQPAQPFPGLQLIGGTNATREPQLAVPRSAWT
ncbi:hypothetical protein MTO96_008336, partial [Rhipicephalus appendiculatus]